MVALLLSVRLSGALLPQSLFRLDDAVNRHALGLAIARTEAWFANRTGKTYAPLLAWLGGAVACGQSLYADATPLFAMTPPQACRVVFGVNPFPESVGIGRYIREHSTPEQTIAVIGSEPEIYFYAGRHSATGYLYAYPLMEPQPLALTMQEHMIREVETNRPQYVVFIAIPHSWMTGPTSHRLILEWFEKYRDRELQLVGLIQLISDDQTLWTWGPEADTVPLQTTYFVMVFKRKGPRQD
jgi:hypothetical protein